MDDDKLAPEGGDTKGAAADTPESQPAPEGDEADQQQQPESDPFANLPYEQARKYYAGHFEEEAGQREKLGFGRGQGEARKEIAGLRKQVEGEMADRIAFERLERMRASDDLDASDAFRREMADPNTAAIYHRGKEAASRPSPDVAQGIADAFLTELDIHLNDRKELQGLSDEEKASLTREKHSTLGKLVDAKIDLSIQHGIAAGVIKENARKLEDAKDEGRHEAYDEIGLEYPAERIEGEKPKPEGKAPPLTTVKGILAAVRSKRITEADGAVRMRELAM